MLKMKISHNATKDALIFSTNYKKKFNRCKFKLEQQQSQFLEKLKQKCKSM